MDQLMLDGEGDDVRLVAAPAAPEGKHGPRVGAPERLFAAPQTIPGQLALGNAGLTDAG